MAGLEYHDKIGNTRTSLMDLYLIRHGEVTPPRPGTFYGGQEVPLSSKGQAEARAAADFLAGVPLQALYCSPLQRARFGAAAVAQRQSQLHQAEVRNGFREIDRGLWVAKTPAEIETLYPGQLQAHQRDLEYWNEHGGESMGQLRTRVLAAWKEIMASGPKGPAAIVSHLWPTRLLVAQALRWPLNRLEELKIGTGSISKISYISSRPKVRWVGLKPSLDFHPGQ
ncbi:MAG: histidine phosphatase family protein [Planctomycetota bacterium]|nr:MAG: histidine phosphatase family protein [Planctomycetota bacterium]